MFKFYYVAKEEDKLIMGDSHGEREKSNIKTNIFCSHNRIRRIGGLKGVKGWERAGGTRGRGIKKKREE